MSPNCTWHIVKELTVITAIAFASSNNTVWRTLVLRTCGEGIWIQASRSQAWLGLLTKQLYNFLTFFFLIFVVILLERWIKPQWKWEREGGRKEVGEKERERDFFICWFTPKIPVKTMTKSSETRYRSSTQVCHWSVWDPRLCCLQNVH